MTRVVGVGRRGIPAGVEGTRSALPPAARPALPLAAALIILGLAYWSVDIVSPALPVIRVSLDLNATIAGLVMSAFFGGRLIANLPAALIVERSGPRVTAVIGALVVMLGSLLAALAASGMVLLAARTVQGAGVALLATAGLLSVLRVRPTGGWAMTAFNVAAGIGGTCGLFASGLLTRAGGWPTIFWFSVVLSFIMFATAMAAKSGRIPQHVPAISSEVSEVQGAATPLPLAGALAANLLVYGNLSIWVVALPFFAAQRFNASSADIGLLLMFVNAIHLLGAFPVGQMIRRHGPLPILASGLTTAGIGMATVALAPDPRWLLLPLALYALGEIAGNSSAGELVLRLGGGGGRAVGLVRLTSDVGLVIGPAVVGVVTDSSGVAAPFFVFAGCSVGGALVAFALRARQLARLRLVT